MPVTVNRRAHFNAAHRLHNPSWSDEKNARIFGKCNNPFYHGHNYEFIVSVTGNVDPETGYVVDMKKLADYMKSEVCDYLDHKNLNEQVAEFKTLNPTAENIAIVIWQRLSKYVDADKKMKVTLYETPRNFVEYDGV